MWTCMLLTVCLCVSPEIDPSRLYPVSYLKSIVIWLQIPSQSTMDKWNKKFSMTSWLHVYEFRLWEENGAPGEIPHSHGRNMQTPRRNAPVSHLFRTQKLKCNAFLIWLSLLEFVIDFIIITVTGDIKRCLMTVDI